MFDPKLREAVVTDIHRFSNQYASVQMVVTSRWLGYRAEALRKAGFQHYMLQDLNEEQIEDFLEKRIFSTICYLNEEQIEDFLEKWHALTFTKAQVEDRTRKQARLQKAIAESKAIRELTGNPLLLTMMAILNRNQELPRDRARLYERASEVLLYQWDVEVKLHEQADLKDWQIDVRDKQAMLWKVAYHMQANEEGLSGNVISREDLEQILMDYLKTREVERARAVARVMIQQLRERNFILCYLGADNYAFVHRTFLEYFCASEFVHQFEKERTLNSSSLKDLYGRHFQDEAWDEVLRLMAGMLEPKFVGKIIEYLLTQPINLAESVGEIDITKIESLFQKRECLKKEGINHLLLAADCLAEVRTRNELSAVTGHLFTRLQYKPKDEYPYWLSRDAATALVDAVATNWGEKDETLLWLKSCLSFPNPSYIPKLALCSIAKDWRDDLETLPILKGRAQTDDNEDVRSTALSLLVKGWKDDSTLFEFWCDRILQDPFKRKYDRQDNLRQIALEVLVQQYPEHHKTKELLHDRAQNDNDEQLRTWAEKQIACLKL